MDKKEFEKLPLEERHKEIQRRLDELSRDAHSDPGMTEMLAEGAALIESKLVCKCCKEHGVHTPLAVDPIVFFLLEEFQKEEGDGAINHCWVCTEHAELAECPLILGPIYKGNGYAAVAVIDPIASILGNVTSVIREPEGIEFSPN